ncbi:uncharacterized protein LAESUDRAFT_652015 [Laetiporus sulphureus 93-53]|uniref:HMG box domain-containing protein n=1 Tax=Laetiporus sulphureus 93-53 TaxID=1314785 RepID=A0A165EIB6_9APHY|nr:uncharacterized protein LAESUDRAFT_652015 [Laetiporus sulphureus 93-53]KZT07111.1 hypothetical protein LAESUDRAFT_652015 [Laetiporus sulphureus 93-53]
MAAFSAADDDGKSRLPDLVIHALYRPPPPWHADGMPPLVDAPLPPMTFTFATDMTPISITAAPSGYEMPAEDTASEFSIYSPPTSPTLGAIRVSHAKKRDASYIPRPPNAFILFRSSFIRAQHIPGKIEGNHSALSKIIGKYWKALPREEREVWEAKAIVAQAEHRKKYPDWRFRPGANALAKVKDGPKRRSNRKGRGEAEKEERNRDQRCAKIADLLVAGKTGSDLEAAIQAYDSAVGFESKVESKVKKEVCATLQAPMRVEGDPPSLARAAPQVHPEGTYRRVSASGHRSKTPDGASDARFKVPLTAMFKRSSSAPAHSRNNSVQFDGAYGDNLRSVQPAPPSLLASPNAEYNFSPTRGHEGQPRAGSFPAPAPDDATSTVRFDGMSAAQVSLPVPLSSEHPHGFGDNAALWNEAYASSPVPSDCWSPPLSAFEADVEGVSSPIQSPLSPASNLGEGDCAANFAVTSPFMDPFERYQVPVCSSYSSLKGWDGDALPQCTPGQTFLAVPSVFPPFAGAMGMKDAFGADIFPADASWQGKIGVGVVTHEHAFCQWDSPSDLMDFQQFVPGLQEVDGRLDNRFYYY